MSIKSDFEWFGLDIKKVDSTDFKTELELAYKRKIFQTHPDRNSDSSGDDSYANTHIFYQNILDFINKRRNSYRSITKCEIRGDVICRCGSVFIIEESDVFADCLSCSCFIEIVD